MTHRTLLFSSIISEIGAQLHSPSGQDGRYNQHDHNHVKLYPCQVTGTQNGGETFPTLELLQIITSEDRQPEPSFLT